MVYTIRKLPNKNLYRVRLTKNKKILSNATTLDKAKKQIKAIEIRKRK